MKEWEEREKLGSCSIHHFWQQHSCGSIIETNNPNSVNIMTEAILTGKPPFHQNPVQYRYAYIIMKKWSSVCRWESLIQFSSNSMGSLSRFHTVSYAIHQTFYNDETQYFCYLNFYRNLLKWKEGRRCASLLVMIRNAQIEKAKVIIKIHFKCCYSISAEVKWRWRATTDVSVSCDERISVVTYYFEIKWWLKRFLGEAENKQDSES